ncbi:MAG: bifunctional UDP-sugar hydrolase/5'-nucleotidase [Pseudomonadota bacterium]
MTNTMACSTRFLWRLLAPIVILSLAACAGQNDLGEPPGDLITITVLGTNDVHGQLMPGTARGGLTTLSGYVQNVRDARAKDGGAVLLIDAGDMWQGSLESNLGEGAAMIDAYNALDYTAATVGNHEFDFGPIGELAIPASSRDDPRGVLKLRASEATFPLLNANIVIAETRQRPNWPNVQPSILITRQGIDIGIIGVTTASTLVTTIAGNVFDLEILPLADTIESEARSLRDQGADLIIVTAHAGTRCLSPFKDPRNLARCDLNGEIVRVANALPQGLVDYIVAGHVHEGVAHEFNGIAVTSSYSVTRAFGRVDFVMDTTTGEVIERTIYPPQFNCPEVYEATGNCTWFSDDGGPSRAATYEGQAVQPLPEIVAIADAAVQSAAARKNESLGVTLTEIFTIENNPESPLANLFLQALLEESEADIVVHNVTGGIRSTLPAGALTYGDVYQMFPFDNRITLHEFSGADMRAIFAAQATRGHRRAGFAGVMADIACVDEQIEVTLRRANGREILDDDRLTVLANDFLATAGDGILSPATPAEGLRYRDDGRLTRDALINWFKRTGGTLKPDDFLGESFQEWHMPATPGCGI